MQCLRKLFAMWVDDVFDVWIACPSLKYLSVMTKTHWFSWAIFSSGPRTTIKRRRAVLRLERVDKAVCV